MAGSQNKSNSCRFNSRLNCGIETESIYYFFILQYYDISKLLKATVLAKFIKLIYSKILLAK